jgi:hypothetical protein
VQGDSVLNGATGTVEAALAGWDGVEVASFVGLDTRTAVGVLRERRDQLGAVVVVELGLNDWGLRDGSYDRLIDDMVEVLAGRHVIWLTSARFRPEMDRVNGAIRAAAARHADYEVLEWGPLSDAHPEATYSDHIHLRPDGARLLAGAISGAVEAWWARVSVRCEAPTDGAAASNAVARLYRAFFQRPPDAGGLASWLAAYRAGDLCLPDIAEFFAGSAEFRAAYGDLDVPQFVRRVYLNVLGREPDPDGYTYWAGELAHGGLTRGELMTGFSESPEFRALTGLG